MGFSIDDLAAWVAVEENDRAFPVSLEWQVPEFPLRRPYCIVDPLPDISPGEWLRILDRWHNRAQVARADRRWRKREQEERETKNTIALLVRCPVCGREPSRKCRIVSPYDHHPERLDLARRKLARSAFYGDEETQLAREARGRVEETNRVDAELRKVRQQLAEALEAKRRIEEELDESEFQLAIKFWWFDEPDESI